MPKEQIPKVQAPKPNYQATGSKGEGKATSRAKESKSGSYESVSQNASTTAEWTKVKPKKRSSTAAWSLNRGGTRCKHHAPKRTLRHWGQYSKILDESGKAAIKCCSSPHVQELAASPMRAIAYAKVKHVYMYCCYAPPSDAPDQFEEFVEVLVGHARGRSPRIIAGNAVRPRYDFL